MQFLARDIIDELRLSRTEKSHYLRRDQRAVPARKKVLLIEETTLVLKQVPPANDISCHKKKNLDYPGLETSATPANDNSCHKKKYLDHPGLKRNAAPSTKNS
ncbi:hypothetical protein TNCV_2484111 [Trichonephila clavipes]|uniref:Uncharacterized protein n=1 Tax=Trichonephila clavipes TaxID=2585209 RepID=A0A8X7BAR0_TRICX|nr:hypothetical protein TNCV_2484111 [Trichonephila clavipes]